MEINSLQAFLAVAGQGSFSLAAEQLHLTQPAVSKRVAALEDDLGVRLFERLGRRVLLTEAGKILLPRAQRIMAEMVEAKEKVIGISEEVGGILQLATSHHIGLHRLPDILREYSKRYPQVELDLHFMASEQGWASVAAGDIELAVVTLPEQIPDQLRVQTLWDDPLMVMVSKDHPYILRKEVLHKLNNYPAILPERGTVTRRLIDEGVAQLGIVARPGIETNYLETIRMLVASGLGWSVLPLSMHNEQLIMIELSGVYFYRHLGVVRHRNRELSRAAKALCELLAPETMI